MKGNLKTVVILGTALFIILLNFFIHIGRTNTFNRTDRMLTGSDTSDGCNVKIAPRGGITDTWDKVDVSVYDKICTLQGVTYDNTFFNTNDFEVHGWTLRINFEKDCFINSAWCGTMEIHQFRNGSETVQTLDLRNIDKSTLNLEYILVGQDVLITLKNGDYLIYYPDLVAKENVVYAAVNGYSGYVTTGFIMYYEKVSGLSLDINNYSVEYKFRKRYFHGLEARIFMVLMTIWLFVFVVELTSCITSTITRRDTEKRLTLQRVSELESYNKQIREANKKLEESNSIIHAVTDIYYLIYSASLKDNTFYEIKSIPLVSEFIKNFTSADAALDAISREMFIPEDYEKTHEFYNFSSWTDRLRNQDTCFIETRGKTSGWVRTNLIVSKRDENGNPENVLCALQNVNEVVKEEFERKKRLEEANKIIKSYNQELNKEVKSKTAHIKEIQEKVVRGLANVIGNRDIDTVGHVNRTSDIISFLVKQYQTEHPDRISDEKFSDIVRAAPMHDLGKIYIDTTILCKPGRFTDEEYEKMKQHSSFSGDIVNFVLKDVEEKHFVDTAFNVARYHHERWDGKGYPDHLSGEKIPLEARIMAVADVYDALVSRRCYKDPMDFEKAYSIMVDGMGSQFDPEMKSVFQACINDLEDYYTKSNDSYGE